MSMPRKQFEVWLRRQMFGMSERLKKLIIRHSTATSRLGQILLTIDVPESGETDDWQDWINQTIDEIEGTTQADADGSSTGVEKYTIQAFHEDSNKQTASFNIRMASETSADDDGVMSEPATKSGLLSQMMRHLEVMARTTTMAQAHIMNTMTKTMSKQESVIDRLLAEKFSNIELVEQLLSNKQERELEMMEHAKKIEMQEKLFDKANLLLPMIAGRLTGKDNGNSSGQMSSVEQQIAALSETLTEEQLMGLQNVLDDTQLMTVLDMITKTRQKQNLLLQKNDSHTEQED